VFADDLPVFSNNVVVIGNLGNVMALGLEVRLGCRGFGIDQIVL
jgi:hypothetical protein